MQRQYSAAGCVKRWNEGPGLPQYARGAV